MRKNPSNRSLIRFFIIGKLHIGHGMCLGYLIFELKVGDVCLQELWLSVPITPSLIAKPHIETAKTT